MFNFVCTTFFFTVSYINHMYATMFCLFLMFSCGLGGVSDVVFMDSYYIEHVAMEINFCRSLYNLNHQLW